MPTYSQPQPSDHGFRLLRLEDTDSIRRPRHARHEGGCHYDNTEDPRLAGTIKGPLVLLKKSKVRWPNVIYVLPNVIFFLEVLIRQIRHYRTNCLTV